MENDSKTESRPVIPASTQADRPDTGLRILARVIFLFMLLPAGLAYLAKLILN